MTQISPERIPDSVQRFLKKAPADSTQKGYGLHSTKNRGVVLAMSQSGAQGLTSRANRFQNSQYSLINNGKISTNQSLNNVQINGHIQDSKT